jgi:phytoene synthase
MRAGAGGGVLYNLLSADEGGRTHAVVTDTETRAHVRRVAAGSGSSFYWPMRLLPPDRRDAMFAVYAFCREVDDIADGDGSAAEKSLALDRWRREIGRIFGGSPETETGRALQDAVLRFGLDRAIVEALVDGVAMDATGEAVAPDMDTLTVYCNRVASAVGLLSIRIFGDDSEEARKGAIALGHALQLTNILRDVAEDAARGRLYLPRELLEDYGIDFADPAVVVRNPAVASVCEDLAEVAEDRFAEAGAALRTCDRNALKPAFAMMEIYHILLRKLRARGWTRLDRRPRIGWLRKLWIALKYAVT